MPSIILRSLGFLTVVVTIVALLMQCKTTDSAIQDSSSEDLSPTAKNSARVRIMQQGADEWRFSFFQCRKKGPNGLFTEDCLFNNNDYAWVRYGVVSAYSNDPIDCNDPRLDKKVRVRMEIPESRKYLGRFHIKDLPFSEFKKCDEQDRERSRKLSLECQNSGDWNGPMRLQGCIYRGNDSNFENPLGRGWGVPGAGTAGQALDQGFGLQEVEQIADINSVLNYGRICANRLGPLPAFDCRDGEIIPITKNGELIPPTEGLTSRTALRNKYRTCDKPVYLGLGDDGQCVPYARLGRLQTSNPNVDTVFICRRYNIGDREGNKYRQRGPDVPLHEDVAIVSHDRVTGESCFYQALSGFQSDGRSLPTWRVPPPHEDELPEEVVAQNAELPVEQQAMQADEFWIKPDDSQNFACVTCHDSDPYMHSPYVDQVKYTFPANHPTLANVQDYMVPCDPAKPGQTDKNLCPQKGAGKYSLVSKRHNPPFWPEIASIRPKDGSDDTCVSCHRVGDHNACDQWVPDSVGCGSGTGDGHCEDASGRLNSGSRRAKTDYAEKYPCNNWMPYFETSDPSVFSDEAACTPQTQPEGLARYAPHPTPPGMDQETWENQFANAARAIMRCCDLRGRSGFNAECTSEPITTAPPKPRSLEIATRASDSLPVSIPDNEAGGIKLLLKDMVNSASKINQVDINLVIEHDYIGDLRVDLEHAGTKVTLFDGRKLQPDVPTNPDALEDPHPADERLELSLSSLDQGTRPYRGNLKNFVGQVVKGPWYLHVYDLDDGESGSLSALSGKVSYFE